MTLCGPCARPDPSLGAWMPPLCGLGPLAPTPQPCLNCLRYSLQSRPCLCLKTGPHTESREVGQCAPCLASAFKTFPANQSQVSGVGGAVSPKDASAHSGLLSEIWAQTRPALKQQLLAKPQASQSFGLLA